MERQRKESAGLPVGTVRVPLRAVVAAVAVALSVPVPSVACCAACACCSDATSADLFGV